MTFHRTEIFEEEYQELARLAKVLAHPARLAILKYLAEVKACISGDISNEIPLSRTTVSQHLQVLREAGFIQGQIDGVKINYCLNPENVKRFRELIENYLGQINNNSCCK
ncbi:MAG: winged helix-turn-helix transcriptional regulator [Bacteroidetes bacterium]|nr:winged helix-turn-helix transcriptional regulator [Bacteroidota bacterium]